MSTGILGPTTINLQIPGTLATTSAVRMLMPFSGKITGATVAVTTAPVGSAVLAVLKVGATDAVEFSIGASNTSASGDLTDAVRFAAGDLVELDVTQIGSGTAGANLVCTFTVAQGAA